MSAIWNKCHRNLLSGANHKLTVTVENQLFCNQAGVPTAHPDSHLTRHITPGNTQTKLYTLSILTDV